MLDGALLEAGRQVLPLGFSLGMAAWHIHTAGKKCCLPFVAVLCME